MTKVSVIKEERSPDMDEALSLLMSLPEDGESSFIQDDPSLYQDQANCGSMTVSNSETGPSFWPKNAAPLVRDTTMKPKKKRRRDRNRPNHEIARLRKQVQEMENQVDMLRPELSENERELQVLRETNIDLREKLQRSLENTTTVEKLLKIHADKLLQALPKSLVVSGRNLMYNIEEDDAVFQVLARSVDCRYMDVNRVLIDAGLHNATEEIFDAYVSTSEKDCVLKSRASTLLPYANNLVEKAMWHCIECEAAILPTNFQSMRELGLPIGAASNLIVSKREVHLEEASFTIRMALKEYIEEDRMVYVWDAVGDWPKADTVPHVSTREYGWCYFMPMDSPNLSVLRTFVVVTPTMTPWTNGEIVERVMQVYRHTIDSRYQLLENSLVDASIHSRKSSSVANS